MSDWWFDLILVALLAAMGLLALLLRRSDARADASEDFSLKLDSRPVRSFRWSLYPKNLVRQCGFSIEKTRWVYWPLKAGFALLIPMVAIEASKGMVSAMWLCGLSLVSFMLVDIYLLLRRKRRQEKISASLSFFVSLLVVYLRSGQGLGYAFDSAARFGLAQDNPLAKEVSLLLQEIAAGRERDEAFTCLAERTGVDDLQKIAAVMSVGFSVGSPVAQTLEAQADLLLAKQRQRGAQAANRKTMEAMLPMIMVCFPMFLVLVFYPAGAQIYEVLNLLKELF